VYNGNLQPSVSNKKYGFASDLASQVYESYRVLCDSAKAHRSVEPSSRAKVGNFNKIEYRSLGSVIAADREKKVRGLSCDVNWSLV
jgi:hypothetical protein